MRSRYCGLVAIACFLATSVPASNWEVEGLAAERRSLANALDSLYPDSVIQVQEVTAIDPSGARSSYEVQIVWTHSVGSRKLLVRYLRPLAIAGTALLWLEEGEERNLFLYLPASRITRRLVPSQATDSFFGTDFAYEDLVPKDASDFQVIRRDAREEGCEVLILRASPRERSRYDGVRACLKNDGDEVAWMDFVVNGRISKRLEVVMGMVESSNVKVPIRVVMHDRLDGSTTSSVVGKYAIVDSVPARFFSPRSLSERSASRDWAELVSPDER